MPADADAASHLRAVALDPAAAFHDRRFAIPALPGALGDAALGALLHLVSPTLCPLGAAEVIAGGPVPDFSTATDDPVTTSLAAYAIPAIGALGKTGDRALDAIRDGHPDPNYRRYASEARRR